MTVKEDIAMANVVTKQNILLPLSPRWEALLKRARAEGIPIKHLFLVRHPLFPDALGGYYRDSRDIWCFLDPDDPQGEHQAMTTCFVLLARLALRQPIPTTIEEDWAQEQAAWLEAAHLAHRWGEHAFFTPTEMEARFITLERLYAHHQAAGELAGSRNPLGARVLYRELVDLQRRHRWSSAQFVAALEGTSEDEAIITALVDVDRTSLRAVWHLTACAAHDQPLGALALPQTARSAALLRRVLEEVTRMTRRPLRVVERPWVDDQPLHLQFLLIDGEHDLMRSIETMNAWLIEEAPACAVSARWEVFGQRNTDRIYRLHVQYLSSPFSPELTMPLPATRELWVLFPATTHALLEAAWQRFILSWAAMMEMITGQPLHDGVRLLWEVLL